MRDALVRPESVRLVPGGIVALQLRGRRSSADPLAKIVVASLPETRHLPQTDQGTIATVD